MKTFKMFQQKGNLAKGIKIPNEISQKIGQEKQEGHNFINENQDNTVLVTFQEEDYFVTMEAEGLVTEFMSGDSDGMEEAIPGTSLQGKTRKGDSASINNNATVDGRFQLIEDKEEGALTDEDADISKEEDEVNSASKSETEITLGSVLAQQSPAKKKRKSVEDIEKEIRAVNKAVVNMQKMMKMTFAVSNSKASGSNNRGMSNIPRLITSTSPQ